MAITYVKSGKDCYFLGLLVLLGSETNGRNLSAVRKSEGFLIVGHYDNCDRQFKCKISR